MDRKIILASNSPRRAELLRMQGIDFEVIPAECDETVDFSNGLLNAVKELSLRKARDVSNRYPGSIVVGSDTVVGIDEKVLCKPKDRADAINMLKNLSGRIHFVYTGVAVVSGREKIVTAVKTSVEFFKLTEEEIISYVDLGESLDKAGGYGIQGKGAYLVHKINGDYYSVMGLPVAKTVRAIKKIDEKLKKM